MAKNSPTTTHQKRKPRLLWANPFCLLDTSSGASMTVRQMLHQLVKNGYEVQVLGCTIFDNPKGMGRLKDQYPDLKNSLHQLIEVEDGTLYHQLVVTARTARNHLTTHEEGLWYSQYLYMLDSFKPDIVWFYGGQTLDLLIPDEARSRGIPSAFYLANGNYKAVRWCRDVDLILTDSQSTADMYRKNQQAGFAAKPVGKFIDPTSFVADTHQRERLLFVNPCWQKGASVVVQLALALEKKRPDIQLEVVEARTDWSAVLSETTKKLGEERTSLPNVIVTPNTSDMRGPYSRARLVLAPSLWWESSGRVLAEAMLNGIPALITNRGGMPEMIGDAGLAFDLPEECYEEPYQHLLSGEQLQPLLDATLDFYDDTALYEKYVQRALEVGKQRHHIDKATERLVNALTPLIKLKAGNKDFTLSQQRRHRQGLASIASKPKFKVDASLLTQSQSTNHSEQSMPLSTVDFDWQLSGKLIVLDSRAKLLKIGAAENLTDTGAFGIIAFDPASEVSNPKQYEGSETVQVFQHALLGDGNPAMLHTCLDASMSSTLEPLPQEMLPEQYRQGVQVLTKLPINTVALDKIEGLPSIDWLILDELSDTATILEHGQQALKDTLIIQARVAFQLTHKHQPSLAELQHWASRNGFRFYRLNESQHASHLPQDIPEQKRQATELVSADALFLPSAERMKTLSEGQRTRLAFLLHTVYNITDITFEILNSGNEKISNKYLEATGLLESTINKTQQFKNVQDIVEYLEKAHLKKSSSNHTLPEQLVVSLTSYKTRFNNLHLTLRSLLIQETQPDLLVLWIAEHEKNDIPDKVRDLEQYGLIIRFCEDLRSYKKIIPTLEEYPESFIVTADDDLYYKPDWLQKLVASWDGNYKTVTAHRAHKIRLDNKGNPAPYRSWKWQVGPEEAADGLIVPTGCGGAMYPPHVFHEDVTKSALFMDLCPDADDIWLYWMASLKGAKAKRSNYNFQLIEWPCVDKSGLWEVNIFQNGNDRSVSAMLAQYNFHVRPATGIRKGSPQNKSYKKSTDLASKSDPSNKFIFIVGCGRSGNTLMRRLLMENYSIYIPPETYILPTQASLFSKNRHIAPWSKVVDSVFSSLEKTQDFEAFGIKTFKPFCQKAKQWPEHKRTFSHLISGAYTWLSQENGIISDWTGDKTPINTLNLEILNNSFPNARFIYMRREPYDVVSSYLKAGIYNTAEQAIKRWLASERAWKNFKNTLKNDCLFEVDYENLASNYGSVLQEIESKFCIPRRRKEDAITWENLGDIALREHYKNVKSHPFTSSIGKGRNELKNEEIEIIAYHLEKNKI